MSPTVAVLALPSTPGKTFSQVVDPAIESLQNKYAGAKVERVQFPFGEAVKISFEKEATFHPGVKMQTITYYVPDTSRIVVVSAALPNTAVPTLEPQVAQMVQTLRL